MNKKDLENRDRPDSLLGEMSRRRFLQNSTIAAGAAATTSIAFSPPLSAQSATQIKTLVYVFLRGGMDGLSLIVPTGNGTDAQRYRSLRPGLHLSSDHTDTNRRTLSLNGGQPFGLHPAATHLRDLFNRTSSPLAIIQGVGNYDPATYNRSHFDAQEQIELGTPGQQSLSHGWISRHLTRTARLPNALFHAVCTSYHSPQSLHGWPETILIPGAVGASGFKPGANSLLEATQFRALRAMYAENSNLSLDVAAHSALDAVETINGIDFAAYTPAAGVTYPDSVIGRSLKLIATMIKRNMGLNVATVDFGGWDTHNNQGVANGGDFYRLVAALSEALSAFYRDMEGSSGFANRVAVVVQTEFGRQITQNASAGTDHGLAYPMLVLGGKVKGGWYGQFPGLGPGNTPGDAVKPMVDFRQVLATVIDKLIGSSNPQAVFNPPGSPFNYSPMGFWKP